METTLAPNCYVVGCPNIACLTDVATSRLLRFVAHYCADCYLLISEGQDLEIDCQRLIVLRPCQDEPRLEAVPE